MPPDANAKPEERNFSLNIDSMQTALILVKCPESVKSPSVSVNFVSSSKTRACSKVDVSTYSQKKRSERETVT